MILEDDRIVLAAEYILGTLDSAEIAEAERLRASEPDFARLVREWERRLGELSAMVAAVAPPAVLLERIHALLPEAQAQPASADPASEETRVRLGAAPQLEVPAQDRGEALSAGARDADTVHPPAPLPVSGDEPRVAALSSRVRRWRAAGIACGALAVLFAATSVASIVRPDLLPVPLRPRPQVIERPVETAVEKPPPPPGRFIAVLQRDSVSPAFILTVDPEARAMTVRRVAAETPAGKSYELWLVSSQYAAPRSLGVVGAAEYSVPQGLANYPPEILADATYAISLEPEGGSPSGQVTGPLLWSGKLIAAMPSQPVP